MKKQIANIITLCRILCSILLLFFPVCSLPFYILYLLCGVSDMTDGAVARKTNSVSGSGARLDTAADLIFVAVSFAKWLPVLPVPSWLWAWMSVIAVIRLCNLISGFIRRKPFTTPHTVPNKLTGALLFLLPLTLPFIDFRYSAVTVCSIATAAAAQEHFTIRKGHTSV